jgi:2-methylisocitrate lyase-like PEP mutase family enzyme
MAQARIEQFRSLHQPRVASARRALLVLPNAWDALSARLVEEAGAEAIATTSAVLAWAHGYRDGERLPFETLLRSVQEITARVHIPTSVDFERGYADEPARVAELVDRLFHAGAVGVNLEDGAASPEALGDKIRAVRARVGAGVFINARTCVVLHGKVSGEGAAREVIERARVFEAAGADGLFVPRLHERSAIEAIARATKLPLNIVASPGLPPLADLAAMGVRRLSAGPQLGQVAYSAAAEAARAWLSDGSCALPNVANLDYARANALFEA